MKGNREISLAKSLKLYLATDDSFVEDRDLVEVVEAAVGGGVTAVQLRLKAAPAKSVYETGRRLLDFLRPRRVPLIINDRVDIMLALGADGVHVGRGDLPLPEARRLAGDRIVGYSVNTLEHLRFAEEHGADYVGVGPVFSTGTKKDTGPVLGLEGLRRIIDSASIPCVAIGGVTPENYPSVVAAGAAGCCIVSAVFTAADPTAAAAAF